MMFNEANIQLKRRNPLNSDPDEYDQVGILTDQRVVEKMKYIVGWTKKLIGTFFTMPKYTPLLPRDLTASARRTLSFANVPSQFAHLDLFNFSVEPIQEPKLFKMTEDLTKKYLSQNMIDFTDTIEKLLAKRSEGLFNMFPQTHDFDTFKPHPFAHQLSLNNLHDTSLLSLLSEHSNDIKFDTTHSSIAIFSVKPSFISSSYQEAESSHNSNENSEYFQSADFPDKNITYFIEENNNISSNAHVDNHRTNILPRL